MMTLPMEPNQPLRGDSEYSHEGMFPHPDLDYQTGWPTIPLGEGTRDNYQHMVAQKRTDTTDPTSQEDLFALGNPDRYGGQPPLVKESPNKTPSDIDVKAPGGVKGAKFKTGVTREG